ncbi:MAG: acyltransferase, partial [Litorimonas sp.]
MSIESTRLRLDTVQALRGVAATLVVIVHAVEIWREMTGADLYPGPWDRGWAGVDLFFVISGFIMVWICGNPNRPRRRPVRFLADRMTRIYPLWWLYCGVMAGYFLVSYGQPSAPGSEMPGGAAAHFALSMALWPTGQLPVLGVGWTLTFELAFYAVFALMLLVRPKFWPPILALWAAAIALSWPEAATAALPGSWLGVVLNPLSLQFILGALAAWVLRAVSLPVAVGWVMLLAGSALFAGLLIFGGSVPDIGTHGVRALTFGSAGASIVAGLVTLE